MCVVDIFVALEVAGRCSGALGGVGPQALSHRRLLAEQDGSGCASGRHAEMWAGLVLGDRVPDALAVARAFLLMVVARRKWQALCGRISASRAPLDLCH